MSIPGPGVRPWRSPRPSRPDRGERRSGAGPDGRTVREEPALRVKALTGLLLDFLGEEELSRRATRLKASSLLRSARVEERVLGLVRLIREDSSCNEVPRRSELAAILDDLEDRLAEQVARRTLERRIAEKAARKIEERQYRYLQDLKLQILSEEAGPDNARTLRKYVELEKQNRRPRLSRQAVEVLRPRRLSEIVGQEAGIQALLSKLASPFPQHVLLYGPPGVGKTTAVRLVLEEAKRLAFTPFAPDAPFVEVNGATLRWDPREVANPLLGTVHDPIYQGARRDLAEAAIPEPRPGLVTQAHGGILFIDEIGEMDPLLQAKLLKVLEDKRVTYESPYYDPDDPHVPKYIKKLFEEGAPADFILVGATTRDPSEINPALRSRCGEVFFDPLTPSHIEKIVEAAALRLGVELEPGVAALIGRSTGDARKATQILADAYGLTLYRTTSGLAIPGEGRGTSAPPVRIEISMVQEILRLARLVPPSRRPAAGPRQLPPRVGRALALAVSGFVGSILEVEAIAYPARGSRGKLRFNEAAGQMTRDSLFNAVALAEQVTGKELREWHVYVNVLGGGRVEGPSAGAAILLALLSALLGLPVRQDLAVTGEVSLHGGIRAVGGIPAKLYGAARAGVRIVLLPEENRPDVPAEPPGGIDVRFVSHLAGLWREAFDQEPPEMVRQMAGLPASPEQARR